MIIDSRKKLETKLVELMVEHLLRLLETRQQVVLGVVGGRSVAAIFKLLRATLPDWSRIHVFLLDERLVDYGDPESNFSLLEGVLGEVEGINLYPVVKAKVGEAHDREYTEALQGLGGRFDILLLSGGEDGHVASLFPDHPVMDVKEDIFVTIANSPKPPACRVTATRSLLEKAEVGFLMILGEGKREALALYCSDVSVRKCPAKLIQVLSVHYVFTDINGGVE